MLDPIMSYLSKVNGKKRLDMYMRLGSKIVRNAVVPAIKYVAKKRQQSRIRTRGAGRESRRFGGVYRSTGQRFVTILMVFRYRKYKRLRYRGYGGRTIYGRRKRRLRRRYNRLGRLYRRVSRISRTLDYQVYSSYKSGSKEIVQNVVGTEPEMGAISVQTSDIIPSVEVNSSLVSGEVGSNNVDGNLGVVQGNKLRVKDLYVVFNIEYIPASSVLNTENPQDIRIRLMMFKYYDNNYQSPSRSDITQEKYYFLDSEILAQAYPTQVKKNNQSRGMVKVVDKFFYLNPIRPIKTFRFNFYRSKIFRTNNAVSQVVFMNKLAYLVLVDWPERTTSSAGNVNSVKINYNSTLYYYDQ